MSSSLFEAEWGQVLSDAAEHGVTGILYRRLKAADPAHRPPASAWQELRHAAHQIAAKNLSFAHELATILRACRAAGLDCIPLRGLALAEQLGWDLTARPMNDLDLLVRREDLALAAETLTALGYREIDRRPGFARTFSYTLEFIRSGTGQPLVEPHWTIAYPPFADRVDMAKVWQRRRRGTVAGLDTSLLDPTDLLLHLCFHLIHKGEEAPLLWWYELHRLIRQQGASLDWPDIVLITHQTGQGLFLAEALNQLRQLFGSPVPPSVLALLTETGLAGRRAPACSGLEERLVRLLAGDDQVDGRESFAQLLTIKGLRPRLRFAFALLFPTSAFMRFHYGLSGRTQVAVWYVKRLLFLVREGAKGLARLIFPAGKSLPSSPS
ncbi:MAG: nucleotidyltransferase family protein [Nitrospirota bacterium]